MFEVIAIWDGEFFLHQALTEADALEWFAAYAQNKNCRVRIWDTCQA